MIKHHHLTALVGLLILTAAPDVSAVSFTRCTPAQQLWTPNPDDEAQALQLEEKRCSLENAVFDHWAAKMAALDNAKEELATTANAGNWDAFRASLATVKPILIELEQTAAANSSANGAADVRALFGQELNYLFQNAGLPLPSSLTDALAKVEAASKNPELGSQAATVAATLANQATWRAVELVNGLSKAAGNTVKAEAEAQIQTAIETRKDRQQGRTVGGYFGGLLERVLNVWKPWLLMLLVVTFGGAWLGMKRRLNPVTVATAAGLAYVLPGSVMALAFVFLPFLPHWLIIGMALVGTLLTYIFALPVFSWAAARVGMDTPTARRLMFLGHALQSLRKSTAPQASATPQAATVATHGSARWGTSEEINKAGHLNQQGLALARVPDAPAGRDQRFRYVGHVVTVAPNGSGKGIGAVIPNLLEYPGSCLVLDVKGENAAVTARARRQMGHKVYSVDPFAVNGSGGAAFNVLQRLNLDDADCVSESAALADSLVIAEGKGGNADHFDESAKTLLQGLMLYVASLPEQRRNLGELRRLLTTDEETFITVLADMAIDDNFAFGIPARAANTLMGMADRERGSVLSTARRHTAFLDDPRIAAALSRTDFDLNAIKSELMTVYLVMPANKIAANARFMRLFIGCVISAVTATAKQPPHRVVFMLDEFAQLGYMKSIEDAVSLMRGYGLAFWVFLQDLSQLKGVYPRWQTFMANSAKVFFGTDDYDTAKYVSDSLGQSTIEYETHNESKNSGTGMSGGGGSMNSGKSAGSAQQLTARQLLTPDEVMRMGPERPIVLVKGEYPYQLKRLNYLTDPEYADLSDPNPYHG